MSHYLIEFINFTLYNQDLKITHATLAVFVDFSKAFNRIDHTIVVTLLCELGVPGWLLNIIIGFLKNRKLVVAYRGEKSDTLLLPNGGPQGTIFGLFLFLILMNEAGISHIRQDTGILA